MNKIQYPLGDMTPFYFYELDWQSDDLRDYTLTQAPSEEHYRWAHDAALQASQLDYPLAQRPEVSVECDTEGTAIPGTNSFDGWVRMRALDRIACSDVYVQFYKGLANVISPVPLGDVGRLVCHCEPKVVREVKKA